MVVVEGKKSMQNGRCQLRGSKQTPGLDVLARDPGQKQITSHAAVGRGRSARKCSGCKCYLSSIAQWKRISRC